MMFVVTKNLLVYDQYIFDIWNSFWTNTIILLFVKMIVPFWFAIRLLNAHGLINISIIYGLRIIWTNFSIILENHFVNRLNVPWDSITLTFERSTLFLSRSPTSNWSLRWFIWALWGYDTYTPAVRSIVSTRRVWSGIHVRLLFGHWLANINIIRKIDLIWLNS